MEQSVATAGPQTLTPDRVAGPPINRPRPVPGVPEIPAKCRVCGKRETRAPHDCPYGSWVGE